MTRYCFTFDGKGGYFDLERRELVYDGASLILKQKYAQKRRRLYVIFSKRCNLSCSYCFQRNDLKDACKYDTKNILQIFTKVFDDFDEFVLFGGEPLLDENLESVQEILQFVSRKPLYVFTNGNISQKAKQIVLSHTNKVTGIVVTLDGMKNIHDAFRPNRSKSSFERAFETIKTFSQNNVFVQVQINVGTHNLQSVQDLLGYLGHSIKKDALHIMINPIKYSSYTLKQPELLNFYISMRRRFPYFDIQVNSRLIRNLFLLLAGEPIEKSRCGLGTQVVADFSNRCVYACPQNTDSVIGSINGKLDYDFCKVEALKKHTDFLFGECSTCAFNYLCSYGCPFEVASDGKCKEDMNSSLKILFTNFDLLFDIEA